MHPCRVLVSLGALMTGSAIAQDLTPSRVFEVVSPSVVVVEALNRDGKAIAQGSGVVTEPGVVVTNCHVLKQAEGTRVRAVTQKWAAHVRHKDEVRDLCSLSVAGLTAPSVTMRQSSTLKVGEPVYALGAPQGFELTLSDGIISSLRQVDGGAVLQVTAPISPGSSGGGLFDAKGRLIGITTLYWKESQQLNFAVPADWIAQLPRRSGVTDARLDPASRRAFPPQYPAELVGSGVAGDVNVIVTLSDKGLVDDVAIEKSSRNRLLDEAAKAAAWRWTYYPAQLNGKPVPSRIRVPLSFEGGPVASAAARQPGNVETARALQQLVDYDAYMLKNDPTYASKRSKLDALVREIRKSRPPQEWLEATSEAYRSIPSEAAGSSQNSLLLTQYISALIYAINAQWLRPASVVRGSSCKLLVHQLDGGIVQEVEVADPCGFDEAGKESIRRAAFKASPLPYAGFEKVFNRRLLINFRPEDLPSASTVAGSTGRWTLIYDADDRSIEMDSITKTRAGNYVSAWTKTTYTTPSSIGTIRNAKSIKTLHRYNCAARTIQVQDVTVYGVREEVLDSGGASGTVTSVIPESIGEVQWEAACER